MGRRSWEVSNPSDYPPHRLGAWGERLARRELQRRGWTILARNYRLGRSEVDLVARREGLVAFVEVKTRVAECGRPVRYGPPECAVTARKRREIESVARDFLVRRRLHDVDIRFDVVAIVVGRDREVHRFTHLEDAWRPDPR